MRNYVHTWEAPRWAGEPCDPVDAVSSLAFNAIRIAHSRSSNLSSPPPSNPERFTTFTPITRDRRAMGSGASRVLNLG